MSLDPTKEYFFGEQEQVTVLDPNKEYDFGADPRQLYREAPQTGFETGVIIGTELLGTVLGGLVTGGNPLGFASGSALGNYLSQQYRISRGLQDDVGRGELVAATVLGGVGVGRLAGMGAVGRTATRAAQGSGLAGAELTARTFIDEGRAPTKDEIATTLLFGGVFGGGLGAVEAKFLKDLGLPAQEGQKRLEFKEAVQEQVKEAGGASNYEVGRPVGFFTFRDPQGNFTFRDPDTTELTTATALAPNTGLGPRRLRQLDQPQLPGPRGLGGPQQARIGQSRTLTDDGIIEVDAIPVEDYAEGLLSGIENKLLLESEDMIKGISSGQELTPEMQNLRNAFNAKLASDNEIFTGVNPIVAKGNIGDTRRLREIDEQIARISHRGKSTKQRKQLEKEKRALERKHNIVQNVLLGGAGVSAAASMFTEEEEASGSSLAMAGFLGFFGIRKSKKVTDAMARGANKAKAKNASDEAIRAKGNIPPPEPEPIGRAAVEAERKQVASSDRIPAKRVAPVDDIKRFYSDELIKQLEESNDPNIQNIIAEELSERASRDTPRGRALKEKLFRIVTTNREISDETFNALNRARDAPPGTQNTIPNVRGVSQAKNAELVQLAKNGDPEALQEIRKRAAKNPKTKKLVEREGLITGLLTTGTGAIALMEMMEDKDDSVSRASLGGFELLLALALGTFGYRQTKKYIKTAEFKKAKAQIKANPSAAEHTSTKQARVAQDADRIYKLPGKTGKIIKDVRDILGDVLAPLSREAKNIGPFVAKAFREVDLKGLKRKSQFKKAAQPFILSVNKLLKNDKVALEKFNDDLNTGNFDGIREMLDKRNVMHKFGKEFKDTLDTLTAIRAYGREEGGIEVGFRENYFPRQVLDYPSLRKFLDSDPDAREATTSIDRAFAKYADEHKISVDNLTNQERAEITARTLAGRVKSSGPGNTKTRSINDVELYQKVKGGYAKPLDALNNYIDSMVDAVEKRKFLGQVKSKNAPNVGMEGSFDTNPLADLGMRADISDTLADKVAKNMLKGQKYSEQDIQKLRSLIQSRFGGVPVSPAIQGLKNANYIQVMTNFGSAITQFGDVGFSAHFNGMDNTFKSLFNRKDVYNFTDSIGLSGKDYDTTSSNAFLSKTLDTLFTATGLKKIDQLGKNTFMNAAWRKYHKIAKKDTKGLSDELTPYFGRERADQISIAARDNAPNSKFVPLEVEELVFHKLLDVAPATASEMPALYTRMGKGRIFYMLKSFTIKQLDAYREAGADEIFRGIGKYNAATTSGERLAAAKEAGNGLVKLTQLAAIFAAANASTDVIKDTLAGRPTKKDELVENNIWKLFGLNRFTYYNAKREGGAKALVELMLPPTAVFDRAWTDISSTLSGEEYKGAMLQGTPLDLIYWRYLGGVDKVKNMQ